MPRTQTDPRPLHKGFTASLAREHGYEPLRVDGKLPAELRGTLVRNGPGLYELFGRPYSHPFECDGALLSVRFADGRAEGAHRVVESTALEHERNKGRPMYGTNATQIERIWNGLRMRRKNAANTSVTYWQGRLFALFEAGLPTEIALEDLRTIGEADFGVLEQMLSAHPHRVPSRKASYNFGQRIGRETFVDIFEFPDVGRPRKLRSFAIPGPMILHDFIATESHMIFFIAPLWMRMVRSLLRLGSFVDFFRWAPEDGTEVVVVPFDSREDIIRFDTDPFFTWHFANAYNLDSGEISIDFVRYADADSFQTIADPGAPVMQGILSRVILDPKQRRLSPAEPLSDLRCEFPLVDPERSGTKTDAIWISSDDATCRIARVDPETRQTRAWELDQGQRPSEAVYVANESGPGWALTLVYDADAHESHIAVLDGEHLDDGPIARVFLDHHVPTTFHGIFIPAESRA